MSYKAHILWGIVCLLAACTTPTPRYSLFPLPDADISIEYPTGWEIEDDGGGLLAFHPAFSTGEELTPSNAFYVWVLQKRLFPSLQDVARSQKNDMETTSCEDPVEAVIGENTYPGLHMSCANGTEHFFIEGAHHYISLSFDANSPDVDVFSHMKDSIK